MNGDLTKSRPDARSRSKPASLAIFVLIAVAGSLAGTSARAHQVERASAIDEIRVDLDREPILIPHHAGQVAISFRPGFGSMRAELAFRGQAALPAHLHVPLSNGSLLNVDFRGRRGVIRSTQPLAKLVDGTLLDLIETDGVHRLVLRDSSAGRLNRAKQAPPLPSFALHGAPGSFSRRCAPPSITSNPEDGHWKEARSC